MTIGIEYKAPAHWERSLVPKDRGFYKFNGYMALDFVVIYKEGNCET